LHKTGWRHGKRVGTLRAVQAFAAALALGTLALVALGAFLAARLGRRARGPDVQALLGTAAEALGDAALLLDPGGVVLGGNAEAARLAGVPPERLAGSRASVLLGGELATLQAAARRAPGAALVTLQTAAGTVRARALVVPVGGRPARDVAILRRERAELRPPPLPLPGPPPAPPRRAEAHADLAAVGAALREPAGRAATALAMLRLLLPPSPGRTDEELARLEAALADLERRLGALAAAGAAGAGRPRDVDLAALVRELLGGIATAPGIQLRSALRPARALADEGRVRAALREVLRVAAEALPAGGELAIAVAQAGASAAVELSSTSAGGVERAAAAVARALLGPEGGRVEVEVLPGRGPRCRITLPAARTPAIEPA
jgi:hypothetical protein